MDRKRGYTLKELRPCPWCHHSWPVEAPNPEQTLAGHWCPRRPDPYWFPHEHDDWHDGECSRCDRLAELAEAERTRAMRDGFLTDRDGPDDF